MILDVDIGNSNVKWRLGDYRGLIPLRDLTALALPGGAARIARVRVACVAGEAAEQQFNAWSEQRLGVMPEYARVGQGVGGVTIAYPDPAKLGVDRWLAMLAAFHKAQGACVVIDVGSALTVDFVDSVGVHCGGLILPGVRLMGDALFGQTHAVKVSALTPPQTWQPGCDTVSCVENAMAAALTGLVRELTDGGKKYCGAEPEYFLCGGDARLVACRDSRLQVYADLVFDGLSLALG